MGDFVSKHCDKLDQFVNRLLSGKHLQEIEFLY